MPGPSCAQEPVESEVPRYVLSRGRWYAKIVFLSYQYSSKLIVVVRAQAVRAA